MAGNSSIWGLGRSRWWVTAADRLIDALEQRPVPPSTEVEVQLVVRESTGRAPRGRPASA